MHNFLALHSRNMAYYYTAIFLEYKDWEKGKKKGLIIRHSNPSISSPRDFIGIPARVRQFFLLHTYSVDYIVIGQKNPLKLFSFFLMHTTTFSPSEGKNTCLKNKKYVEKSQPCLALNLIDFQIAKPQTNFVYFVPLLQSERVLILWNVTIFLKK